MLNTRELPEVEFKPIKGIPGDIPDEEYSGHPLLRYISIVAEDEDVMRLPELLNALEKPPKPNETDKEKYPRLPKGRVGGPLTAYHNAVVDLVAVNTKHKRSEVVEIIDELVCTVQNLLIKGYEVKLDGLGYFRKRTKKNANRLVAEKADLPPMSVIPYYVPDPKFIRYLRVGTELGRDQKTYKDWLLNLQRVIYEDEDIKTDEEIKALLNQGELLTFAESSAIMQEKIKGKQILVEKVKRARVVDLINKYGQQAKNYKNPKGLLKLILLEQELLEDAGHVPMHLQRYIAQYKKRLGSNSSLRKLYTDEELEQARKELGEDLFDAEIELELQEDDRLLAEAERLYNESQDEGDIEDEDAESQ